MYLKKSVTMMSSRQVYAAQATNICVIAHFSSMMLPQGSILEHNCCTKLRACTLVHSQSCCETTRYLRPAHTLGRENPTSDIIAIHNPYVDLPLREMRKGGHPKARTEAAKSRTLHN
jgi:hypothetical protein